MSLTLCPSSPSSELKKSRAYLGFDKYAYVFPASLSCQNSAQSSPQPMYSSFLVALQKGHLSR